VHSIRTEQAGIIQTSVVILAHIFRMYAECDIRECDM
jgi:hypothetical protein